jgi:hypothetical protein
VNEATMDSGSVKPVRRWPLLPNRKAGAPSTVPESPTGHVNPATAVPAASAIDPNEQRRRDPAPHTDANASDESHPPAHLIDREI